MRDSEPHQTLYVLSGEEFKSYVTPSSFAQNGFTAFTAFASYNPPGINVPFLNYLGNIRARIGHGPTVRVGGNTQEYTELFLTSFPNHEIINKTLEITPNSPVSRLSRFYDSV